MADAERREDEDRERSDDEDDALVDELIPLMSQLGQDTAAGLLSATNRLSGRVMSAYFRSFETVEDEAKRIVRDAEVDHIAEEYETGQRVWVWPPPTDQDWQERRAVLSVYLYQNLREVWRLEPCGLLNFLFIPMSAVLQGHLDALSRDELVELAGGEACLKAYLSFLKLD